MAAEGAAREAIDGKGDRHGMVSPCRSGPALIGTAVAMYVILDGFDLGIGILFPFARNEASATR